MLIQRGRLSVPEGADLGHFILTDGKSAGKPKAPKIRDIRSLFERYELSQFYKSKEKTTRKTESIHLGHLRRLLAVSQPLASIRVSDLQAYVDKRIEDKFRGKPIIAETVKNETVTFRLIWNWAVKQELISKRCPTQGLVFPNRDERPPFMTREEIELKIARGGLNQDRISSLWECLYLSRSEVNSILSLAQEKGRQPFLFPMLVMAAYTGARRSELLRCEIDDFDFASCMVHLREKKKSRSKAMTFRRVPMSPYLKRTIKRWLKRRPSTGQRLFVSLEGKEISESAANYHFSKTFEKTEWNILRGFHVFRHSFCSNCATCGIDQRLINEWVGHQTDEMVNRYRHLFPENQHLALQAVFG